MIIVIADDFTGAAELAGISLRYGLKVNVCLNKIFATDADVLVVCTDSRSLNNTAAQEVTGDAVKKALNLKPSFIYKKIDSVLRGHVADEINVQLAESGLLKALILPANPSLGRTIHQGEYFINGLKIKETGFADDPEFPVKSSSVIRMIGKEYVKVLKNTDNLPSAGIIIGEAKSVEDIQLWASVIDTTWMLVGAGDFYTALLENKYQQQFQPAPLMQLPHLYVCGTAFSERKQFIKKLNDEVNCVSYLQDVITDKWLDESCNIIKKQSKLIVAINNTNNNPIELRTQMAKAVNEIITSENIREIFIEGGSTAAAVLQELNITVLEPVNELSRGVVRMRTSNLFITVKPGSYQLPVEIAELYK